MKAAGDDPESNRLNDIELPSFLNPTPFIKKKTISSLGLIQILSRPVQKSRFLTL
jgi:hypothetical protein